MMKHMLEPLLGANDGIAAKLPTPCRRRAAVAGGAFKLNGGETETETERLEINWWGRPRQLLRAYRRVHGTGTRTVCLRVLYHSAHPGMTLYRYLILSLKTEDSNREKLNVVVFRIPIPVQLRWPIGQKCPEA